VNKNEQDPVTDSHVGKTKVIWRQKISAGIPDLPGK